MLVHVSCESRTQLNLSLRTHCTIVLFMGGELIADGGSEEICRSY